MLIRLIVVLAAGRSSWGYIIFQFVDLIDLISWILLLVVLSAILNRLPQPHGWLILLCVIGYPVIYNIGAVVAVIAGDEQGVALRIFLGVMSLLDCLFYCYIIRIVNSTECNDHQMKFTPCQGCPCSPPHDPVMPMAFVQQPVAVAVIANQPLDMTTAGAPGSKGVLAAGGDVTVSSFEVTANATPVVGTTMEMPTKEGAPVSTHYA